MRTVFELLSEFYIQFITWNWFEILINEKSYIGKPYNLLLNRFNEYRTVYANAISYLREINIKLQVHINFKTI